MTDDLIRAAQAATRALSQGAADAHDLMLLAIKAAHDRDFEAAEALIGQAQETGAHDPSVFVGLSIVRHGQGRLREAVIACDTAIALAPDYPDAWRQRAAVLAAGGSIEKARFSFEQTLRLHPNDAAAHAGLASLGARVGDWSVATEHAEKALDLEPHNLIAASSLASAKIAGGQAAKALALLEKRVDPLGPPTIPQILALSVKGDAYHRLANYDAAYNSYAQSKHLFGLLGASFGERGLTHLEFVEAIHEALGSIGASRWSKSEEIETKADPFPHVFLIGYPRSGTTLVENILASLDGVGALEERPTLQDADREYLSGNRRSIIDALNNFADADESVLAKYRGRYWSYVERSLQVDYKAGFVDMDPLKATRLPFISRLFPRARILIINRDPRDIVWSCFRTNFAATSGTLEYTTLERAARHYDAMMRLTELALTELPLNYMIIRYHELVRDFEATTKSICDFTGLEWSDALFDFGRTAQERGVSTASAAQVRRGLYDGTGQWKPYAAQIETVMPILAPWIQKFGYEP